MSEKSGSNHQEWRKEFRFTSEGIFERYRADLDLTDEDLKKKILDVGSGSARFAKYAEDQGISNQIFSLNKVPGSAEVFAEDNEPFQETKRSVVGSAEAMPFDDQVFDMAISESALPSWWSIRIEDDKELENTIERFLQEMLRVTKPDGEIRLGGVVGLVDNNGKPEKLGIIFDSILQKLSKIYNLKVETKITRDPDRRYGRDYSLVRIKKLSHAVEK